MTKVLKKILVLLYVLLTVGGIILQISRMMRFVDFAIITAYLVVCIYCGCVNDDIEQKDRELQNIMIVFSCYMVFALFFLMGSIVGLEAVDGPIFFIPCLLYFIVPILLMIIVFPCYKTGGIHDFIKYIPDDAFKLCLCNAGTWTYNRCTGQKSIKLSKVPHLCKFTAYVHARVSALLLDFHTIDKARFLQVGYLIEPKKSNNKAVI